MQFFSNEPGDLTSSEARAHPLAFYRQFFAGWTQEDLSARAPIVYERLRRKGLLRQIPAKTPSDRGDPLAYYRQHYAGLTRGQLHDQAPRLYDHFRRHGLLGHIPLKPKVSFPDPQAFYREHCAGMTRKQAALAEPQFYRYLQRRGLLDTIPFAAAAAADGADRDARPQALPPDTSPSRQTAKPAEQRQLRPPSLSSARLGSFRIIPE